MSPTIYFIDYSNALNNNGLNTYTNELIGILSSKTAFRIKIIWLNSSIHNEITKVGSENIVQIYLPRFKFNGPLQLDDIILDTIDQEIIRDQEAIFHINWINHLSLAWKLKKKYSFKILLTKHCLPWRDFVTHNYDYFYELNKVFIKKSKIAINNPDLKKELIGYNNVDHIICVTKSAKSSLVNLFDINESKISIINNGLGNREFTTTKKRLRKKYNLEESEKIILYAAKVAHSKGIFSLVKLFDEILGKKGFKNLRLIIAGPGDHSLVLKTAKKNWSKITLTGSLNKDTLFDFYQLADIGIAPSYTEQCSYTVIEMMQSGLPIIVSDIDGLKEMVNDDCGLKIKIDFKKSGASVNAKDLKEKISFYLENPSEAKRLANNAKKYAMQHFTAERMANETIAVYENVLLEKPLATEIKTILPKNTDALISIVLYCYNDEKLLEECLANILNHNYTNFELIIINDGSTDETEKVIQACEHKRLVYLKNEEYIGRALSLSKAVNKAKGKYFTQINAGDRMLVNRLQLQISFLDNHPEYGLIGSHYHVTDRFGMPIDKVETILENDELKLMMLFSKPFLNSSIIMRTDLIKKVKINFKYALEHELYFKIAKNSKFKILPIILMDCLPQQNGDTDQLNKLRQQDTMQLLSRELDNLGVSHTIEELVLHGALTYGSKYFNTEEKLQKLNNWLNKVLSSSTLIELYGLSKLKKFKKKLLIELDLT